MVDVRVLFWSITNKIYWEKNTADNTFGHENLIAVLCNADFTPCHIYFLVK